MKQIYDNKDIGETIDKSFDAGIKEGYRRCREQMLREAVKWLKETGANNLYISMFQRDMEDKK